MTESADKSVAVDFDDITAFLETQYRADERYAHAASGLLGVVKPWYTWTALKEALPGMSRADCLHIERWSPARVLADIAAKRQVLAIHRMVHEVWTEAIGPTDDPYLSEAGEFGEGCAHCHDIGCGQIMPDGPCETLKAMATPYADRPGFRSEWAA